MSDTYEANNMKSIRITSLAAACTVLMLAAPAANAENISYVTTGAFGSSGNGTYNNGLGTIITFLSGATPPGGLDLMNGESSAVSLGEFDTSLVTNTTDETVIDTFTLSIFQTAPSIDFGLKFLGDIGGVIRATKSGLFLQITSPLVITSSDGRVQYRIVNADNGTPGYISIGAPGTSNTSVNGEVTLLPIPEPSAIALLGLGIPAVLLYRRRLAA